MMDETSPLLQMAVQWWWPLGIKILLDDGGHGYMIHDGKIVYCNAADDPKYGGHGSAHLPDRVYSS